MFLKTCVWYDEASQFRKGNFTKTKKSLGKKKRAAFQVSVVRDTAGDIFPQIPEPKTATLTFTVTDANDEWPQFTDLMQVIQLAEGEATGDILDFEVTPKKLPRNDLELESWSKKQRREKFVFHSQSYILVTHQWNF